MIYYSIDVSVPIESKMQIFLGKKLIIVTYVRNQIKLQNAFITKWIEALENYTAKNPLALVEIALKQNYDVKSCRFHHG